MTKVWFAVVIQLISTFAFLLTLTIHMTNGEKIVF
jgi:hypothetical protein